MSDFIPREYGECPTLETRAEAHEQVDKRKRYSQIIETMSESNFPMSAKEIAVVMANKGYIPTSERNFVAPRLSEMMEEGIVEPVGKIKCAWTGKKVTIYKLLQKEQIWR